MAATVSTVARLQPTGGKRVNIVNVTFDGTYPAGGESLAANVFGLKRIEAVVASSVALNVATAGSQTGFVCASVIASNGSSVLLSLLGLGASAASTEELEEADAVTDQSATVVTLIVTGV